MIELVIFVVILLGIAIGLYTTGMSSKVVFGDDLHDDEVATFLFVIFGPLSVLIGRMLSKITLSIFVIVIVVLTTTANTMAYDLVEKAREDSVVEYEDYYVVFDTNRVVLTNDSVYVYEDNHVEITCQKEFGKRIFTFFSKDENYVMHVNFSKTYVDFRFYATKLTEDGSPAVITYDDNHTLIKVLVKKYHHEKLEISNSMIRSENFNYKLRGILARNSVAFWVYLPRGVKEYEFTLPDKVEVGGKTIVVRPEKTGVYYRVKHDFKYPMPNKIDGRKPYYTIYERDGKYVLNIRFYDLSGDVYIVLNKGVIDYITAQPICDAFGWTEPVSTVG